MAENSGCRGRGRPKKNTEAPLEFNEDWWKQMMRVMQEQTDVLANLVNCSVQPPPPPPPENPNQFFFDIFQLNPLSFAGGDHPLEAQSWIRELNKIFKIVQCTDEQKVKFAAFMLKGAADYWWEGEEARMIAKGNKIDWESFQEVFLDRYFPKFLQRRKEQEFIHIQQGDDMSVAEYVAEFEELARFASRSFYASNEEWKIQIFERGLRSDIRISLAPHKFTNYTSLVHKSFIAEEGLKKIDEECQQEWEQSESQSPSPSKYSQHLKVRVSQNKSKQVRASNSPWASKCYECGKNHVGECLAGKNVCFWCKQPGHVIQNCLVLQAKGSS
ncbi:uncharacterized protein LOC131629950 [Vicia villosa]|uniref:uncharacterized protein LOC131629950 n=1 Tax=Vicia villosa TaxID=3911 RepID=UPI00273B54F1|nr:uncharacterized protein LOC131629950 [Vicia villosa]